MPRCLLHDPVRHTATVAPLDPPEPADGEMVVRVELSAISPGTELRALAGKQANQLQQPYVGGYSAAGRIVQDGHGFQAGDAVFLSHNRHTAPHGRMWGGHVSHAVARPEQLVRVPEGVPLHFAAMGKMLAIGHHGTRLVPQLQQRRALVVGLGIIGQAAARSLAAQGVRVVACDRSKDRVADLEIAGTPAVVPAQLDNAISKHLGDAPDLIVDATGSTAVLNQMLGLLKTAGWGEVLSPTACYVIQGSYPGDVVFDYDLAFRAEASVIVARDCGKADVEEVFAMIAEDRMSMDGFPTDVFDPEDASELYAALATPESAPLTGLIRWA